MRKPVLLAICLLLSVSLALPADVRDRGRPHRYLPGSLDGALVQVDNPVDGRTWSAWSYRNGGEYDLALSVSGGDEAWSEPIFIGLDDGRDQVEPALAVDAWGVVVLAWTDRTSGQILASTLALGSDAWAAPVALTAPGVRAQAAALHIIGDDLVVAYRVGSRVEMIQRWIGHETAGTNSIYDGPDPTGNTGDDEGSKDSSGGEDNTDPGSDDNGDLTGLGMGDGNID